MKYWSFHIQSITYSVYMVYTDYQGGACVCGSVPWSLREVPGHAYESPTHICECHQDLQKVYQKKNSPKTTYLHAMESPGQQDPPVLCRPGLFLLLSSLYYFHIFPMIVTLSLYVLKRHVVSSTYLARLPRGTSCPGQVHSSSTPPLVFSFR